MVSEPHPEDIDYMANTLSRVCYAEQRGPVFMANNQFQFEREYDCRV